tara:strand:+ start:792 stop:1187 length:396 start_codon:yes stop_codon:yes gene_type:complete
LLIVAAYGLAFALQNDKLPIVRALAKAARTAAPMIAVDEIAGSPVYAPGSPWWALFVVDGLRCTWCVSFHAGWFVYLAARGAALLDGAAWPCLAGLPAEGVALAAFALAAACSGYAADELIAALERSGPTA